MVEIIYLTVGILVILFVFLDIILTTFSMEGGGKLTNLFMTWVWEGLLFASGNNGKSKLLNYAGMSMMVSLIFLWGLGIWLGTLLIFLSSQDSILHSSTGDPASIWEKIYFSGYLLTTMGLGDFVPQNAAWGIVSSLFSFFGLVFITLMVSYILPVLSKTVEKKQFSLFIHQMGNSPQSLLLFFWNGSDFSRIKDISTDLQQKILLLSQSHHAYPVLRYFHACRKEESLEVTLCLIDEALSLLIENTDPDQWDEKEVLPLRHAITNYLETIKETYGLKGKREPNLPKPDTKPLFEANVKLATNHRIDNNRKITWFRLLKSQGWTWAEIYPSRENWDR